MSRSIGIEGNYEMRARPKRYRGRRAVEMICRLASVVWFAGILAITSCTMQEHQAGRSEVSVGSAPPLLNSERIRQQFGSYGIDVVSESEHLRVSNLYSVENGRKVTRTVAVVIYPQTIPGPVRAEHAEIKDGHSVGEVFKHHGWRIDKQNIYLGEVPASSEFSGVYASMGGTGEKRLAVHIYRLSVSKGSLRYDYALIAEIHQPDYLDEKRLREIYPSDLAGAGSDRRDIDNTLEIVTGVMKELHPTE